MSAMVRWGLFLATAGGLVFICSALRDPYVIPRLVIISLGGLMAAAGLSDMRSGGGRRALDIPILAGLGAMSLASICSIDKPLSLIGRDYSMTYALIPVYCFAALYYVASRCEEDSWPIIRGCVIAAGLIGAYAVLQGLGLEPFEGVVRKFHAGRVISCIGGPAYLGAVMALLAPLCLHAAVEDDWRWSGCLLLCVAALWLAQSRSGALAGFLGCATYALARWGGLRAILLVILGAVAVGGMMSRRGAAASDTARLNTWAIAARSVPELPVLGSGPATFIWTYRRLRTPRDTVHISSNGSHSTAHNDILQAASTTGYLGLGAYLWLWGAVFWGLWRRRHDSEVAAVLGAAVAVFVQMKLNPTMPCIPATLAVLVGLQLRPEWTEEARPDPKWAAVAFGATLTVSLMAGVASRYSRLGADVLQGPERAAYYLQATEWAPWSSHHAAQFYESAIINAEKRGTRLREVSQIVKRELTLHPNSPSPYHMAGVLIYIANKLKRGGDLADAERHLQRAHEMDREHVGIRQSLRVVREAR